MQKYASILVRPVKKGGQKTCDNVPEDEKMVKCNTFCLSYLVFVLYFVCEGENALVSKSEMIIILSVF